MNEIQTIAWGLIKIGLIGLIGFLLFIIHKKIKKSIEKKRLQAMNVFKEGMSKAKTFNEKLNLADILRNVWPKDFPYMQLSVAAIGIGVALTVGYLVFNEVIEDLSTVNVTSNLNITSNLSSSQTSKNTQFNITSNLVSAQGTVFAGFGIIAVGIIVLSAVGLMNIFRD